MCKLQRIAGSLASGLLKSTHFSKLLIVWLYSQAKEMTSDLCECAGRWSFGKQKTQREILLEMTAEFSKYPQGQTNVQDAQ